MDKHTPAPESTIKRKKLALGRGLGALIPDAGPTFEAEDGFFLCDIGLIRPNRFQPRHQFAEEELEDLTGSIRAQGVLQPLIVRKSEPGFELIAGERRLRAARRAGLSQVPVVVKTVSDDQLLELSLVENIQRENLNPIEEAAGLQRLVDEFRMTHEQVADAIGRSRSATTNLLRLLKLAKPVQQFVMEGTLEMGHARALLALDGARQIEAANRVAARGLSARATEALVARLLRGQAVRRRRKPDRDLARLEEEISERLGTTVEIRAGRKGSGKIVLHYSGLEHLEQLLKKLR
jgi:ParB family chromosome partitioning protein